MSANATALALKGVHYKEFMTSTDIQYTICLVNRGIFLTIMPL